MKKSLSIVLVLLCLLTACQALPDDDQSLASTPSSSSSITPPPSSSVVPPATQPTVPTTQPTVPPTTQPTVPPTLPPALPPSDISDGYITKSASYLYWVVEGTQERILICEQVVDYTEKDTHIFFVKASEPTKVYVTAIGDFENHHKYYQSPYGNISDLAVYLSCNQLQFVADGKKFVVCDLTTGENTVLMEQYHINHAYLNRNNDGTWMEIIEFEGQHTEDDWPYTAYIYNWKTGELELDDPDCV